MKLRGNEETDFASEPRQWPGGICTFYAEYNMLGGGSLNVEYRESKDAPWAFVSEFSNSLVTANLYIGKGQIRGTLTGSAPMVEFIGAWVSTPLKGL